jgi:hypothetical protein
LERLKGFAGRASPGLLLLLFLVLELAVERPVPGLDLGLRGLLEVLALAPDHRDDVALDAVAYARSGHLLRARVPVQADRA